MGLEGQSTLVQNFTFCCCCDVCLRLLHTLLELKVWLPSSSSVCYCLKFCPEQNEWVLVLFWMVELITDLSLPHPPPCSFCRISLVTGRSPWAVQGGSAAPRMWTLSCVCPFFMQAPGQPCTLFSLAAIDTPNTCCWALAWVSRACTAPCLLPSLGFHWRQSGCINLISLEIQSENKLHDLREEELPRSVTVAMLQLLL